MGFCLLVPHAQSELLQVTQGQILTAGRDGTCCPTDALAFSSFYMAAQKAGKTIILGGTEA